MTDALALLTLLIGLELVLGVGNILIRYEFNRLRKETVLHS